MPYINTKDRPRTKFSPGWGRGWDQVESTEALTGDARPRFARGAGATREAMTVGYQPTTEAGIYQEFEMLPRPGLG